MKPRLHFFFVLIFALLVAGPASSQEPKDDLAQGFSAPPESARPRTWWHWVSGNVSREGITADLEAMKQIGLGGAQIFTVDQSAVKGPVVFMSPEWRALTRQALARAGDLHLEMAMEGCDGWSESGGPWVPASESMQQVVWTEKQVAGGQSVSLDLPQPQTIRDFYEDIALYAFPTPEGSNSPSPLKVTASDPAFDGDKLAMPSSPPQQFAVFDARKAQWFQVEYAHPATFSSAHFTVKLGDSVKPWTWLVLAGDNGADFHKITSILNGTTASFPATTARFFRIWVPSLPLGVNKLSVTDLRFGGPQLDQLEARAGIQVAIDAGNFVALPLMSQEAVDPKSLVDLTGRHEWQPPSGNWTLLRIGHTSTGATTHPSTSGGLECDKLSAVAVQHHIQNMFGPVFADSPGQVGTTLKYILLDSWEAGCENWTPAMAAEFKSRRGYDPGPWLPALTGKILGSAELTQRFLWDYRRTLADLVAEKHYGAIQKFAHDHNMGLESEAAGIGMPTVADQLLCKKYTDIPMGEFWVNKSRSENIDDPKEAACAVHLYGKKIAACESFTSVPQTAAWKNDPYSLKALGDEEFCLGVNRFVFHRYAHQPWLDRKPGMSMGPWGINFERTNTWWEPGSAWISYLTRCEYLLQQGQFQADLCYFYGEGAPICVHHDELKPAVPAGYDYDVCNADVLLHLMEEKAGRLTLPGGMNYRVLVLPNTDRMTLPVLQKIAQLVQAGGMVYGPKPAHPPSLTGYPDSDQALTKLAADVWGDCDGKAVTEHAYGQGKIIWGEPLEKAMEVSADFAASQGDLLFIHRFAEPADVYFVSNQGQKALTADCTFRVTGKIPELWHPDTGASETVALYHTENGHTTLPIHFDPVGSVFVVFRRPAPEAAPLVSVKPFGDGALSGAPPILSEGKIKLTAWRNGPYQFITGTGQSHDVTVSGLPAPIVLSGSWRIAFPPKLGAPASATLDHLISWSDSPDQGIKYFSGTAAYTKDFTLPDDYLAVDRRVYLDLGNVKNLAEVSLNGKPLGILWKEPFRVEITGATQAGVNHLAIKVTNLWPNRLIGDQKLPEAQRVTWASVSLYPATTPLLPSGLLGPVKISAAQEISVAP